jgi:hypothetical protein
MGLEGSVRSSTTKSSRNHLEFNFKIRDRYRLGWFATPILLQLRPKPTSAPYHFSSPRALRPRAANSSNRPQSAKLKTFPKIQDPHAPTCLSKMP